MGVFGFLKIEDKWLLSMIDSVPYIEGIARLQKFAILSFHDVLKNEEFFDDWRADDFGGSSPQLAQSFTKLERRGFIQAIKVITDNGYPVNRYKLTEKGKEMIRDFVEKHSSELEKIKSITSNYFQKPLEILLNDVHQKHPDLAINSKIRADVNKITTENDSYLNSQYEIPFSEELGEIPRSIASSQQHVFGDEDFRERLAKSIGLDKMPDLDPQSFDRIKGILSEKINTEDFDSEELVKEVRGC